MRLLSLNVQSLGAQADGYIPLFRTPVIPTPAIPTPVIPTPIILTPLPHSPEGNITARIMSIEQFQKTNTNPNPNHIP